MLRALVIVGCLAVVAVASPAVRAAVLERSEPVIGGALPAGAPVVLEFSSPISIAPGDVTLLDAAGEALPAGPPEAVTDRVVRIAIEEAGTGLRVLTWSGTVAGEEAPVRGSITFDVGGATTPALDVAGIARAAEASTLALALLAAGVVALIAAMATGVLVRRRRQAGSPTIGAISIGAAGAVAVGAALGLVAVLGQPGGDAAYVVACVIALVGAALALVAVRPAVAPRVAAVAAVLAIAASAIALAGAASAARPEPVAPDFQKQVFLQQGGQVSLTMSPSAVGANTATIALSDIDSASRDQPVLVLRPLDGRIGPMRVPLRAADDGTLLAERVLLPFAGRWRCQVEGISAITEDDPAVLDFDVIPNEEVQSGSGS